MTIRMNISPNFVQFTNNVEVTTVKGRTVRECIDDLIKQFPALKEVMFDNKGNIYRYFDIYINNESSYPDELDKPVKDGDVLHVVMLVHGG